MPTEEIADLETLTALETKIEKVADALRRAREEHARAEAALAPLQAAHDKLQRAHAQAEQELVTLRKERNEVRQRVRRLVEQLEAAGA